MGLCPTLELGAQILSLSQWLKEEEGGLAEDMEGAYTGLWSCIFKQKKFIHNVPSCLKQILNDKVAFWSFNNMLC